MKKREKRARETDIESFNFHDHHVNNHFNRILLHNLPFYLYCLFFSTASCFYTIIITSLVLLLLLFFLLLSFANCSLMKVQRMVLTGSDALYYYLNTKFVFKTTVYSEFNAKLNEIDREMFYDHSKVW